MSNGMSRIEKRLRTAGVLLMIGLAVEAVCLLRPRPLSFVALVGLGGVLLAAGLVYYLLSLLSAPGSKTENR